MKPELINLTSRARNPDFYDKTRDMETAIAWNAIKKTLSDTDREDLFKYIKSVRLTEKFIIITTEKPIANGEIKIYNEILLERINTGLVSIGQMERTGVRVM